MAEKTIYLKCECGIVFQEDPLNNGYCPQCNKETKVLRIFPKEIKVISARTGYYPDPDEYHVYIKGDDYPIFVWATEYERSADFHKFSLRGYYNASFPVHQIRDILKQFTSDEDFWGESVL